MKIIKRNVVSERSPPQAGNLSPRARNLFANKERPCLPTIQNQLAPGLGGSLVPDSARERENRSRKFSSPTSDKRSRWPSELHNSLVFGRRDSFMRRWLIRMADGSRILFEKWNLCLCGVTEMVASVSLFVFKGVESILRKLFVVSFRLEMIIIF